MSVAISSITLVISLIVILVTARYRRYQKEEAKILLRYSQIYLAATASPQNTAAEDLLLNTWSEEHAQIPEQLYHKFGTKRDAIVSERSKQETLELLKLHLHDADTATNSKVELESYRHFFERIDGYPGIKQYPKFAESFDLDVITTKAASILQEQIDELMLTAQDDRSAYVELQSLLEGFRSNTHWLRFAFELVSFPAEYNVLVARYVTNPFLADFVGLRACNDLAPGTILRVAAKALQSSDYTNMRIALAYCNYSNKIRAEVGDVLVADMAKFVAQYELEESDSASSDS